MNVNVKAGFAVVLFAWLIQAAIYIGIIGGIAYVSWHFIHKYW